MIKPDLTLELALVFEVAAFQELRPPSFYMLS
jgi:hypothetical protein